MSLPPYPGNEPQPTRPGAPEGAELGQIHPVQVRVRLPQTSPIVTYLILGVTIFIFLLQLASQNLLGADYPLALGAKVNALIRQGEVWRFFTPALLHASLLHIGFNMYGLLIFGRNLERSYGHVRFLLLYGLGAFAGNVLSFLLSDKPSVGASTALFALVAAEGVFIYQNRHIFGRERSTAMLSNVVMLVAINLFLGLRPGIDNWGHLGGLIGGAVFAWLAGPQFFVAGEYPQLHLADRREPVQVWTVAALEALALAAIAAAGIL